MSDDCAQAWAAALDAPPGDLGPWRVLADALLTEGHMQGELIQLELDAEAGLLRGLARLRHLQLRDELRASLLPPGVAPSDAQWFRGVITECTAIVTAAQAPEDARWRSVRHLHFHVEPYPPSLEDWRSTPLTGSHLRHLESLSGLAPAALEVLAGAPGRPRLRRLRLRGDSRFQPGDPVPWARWWEPVLAAHPALREVDLGWSQAPGALEARLATVARLDLDRVIASEQVTALAGLSAWYFTASPRFTLVVQLSSGPKAPFVEIRRRGLELHSPADDRNQLAAEIRRHWAHDLPMPPLRVVT